MLLLQSGKVQSSGDAVLDVSEDVTTAPAPESLREAARVVNQAVTVASRRVEAQLMPEDRFGWESSYALANCYRDGSEGVGPHSGQSNLRSCCPLVCPCPRIKKLGILAKQRSASPAGDQR